MKDSAIVVCLHGNELFSLEVINKISKNIPVFIGNPLAIEKKTRYIDIDLNRAFPGKKDGNYEEKRAFYLFNELKKFKYIIDIHSSSSDTEIFGIITKPNKDKLDLAKKLGIQKLVIMPQEFSKGKSLIDNVDCGISLEVGPHEKKENVEEIIKIINNLTNGVINNSTTINIFRVFDIIKGEDNVKFYINNFKNVNKGDLIAEGKEKKYYAEFDFIPIFIGERAYKGILCLATKKEDSI